MSQTIILSHVVLAKATAADCKPFGGPPTQPMTHDLGLMTLDPRPWTRELGLMWRILPENRSANSTEKHEIWRMTISLLSTLWNDMYEFVQSLFGFTFILEQRPCLTPRTLHVTNRFWRLQFVSGSVDVAIRSVFNNTHIYKIVCGGFAYLTHGGPM